MLRAATFCGADALFESVFLQTWTTGPAWKYWIIEPEGDLIQRLRGKGVRQHLQSIHEREQKRDT